MPIKDLPADAQRHKGEWVALSSDETRVVGHGKTPEIALKMAKEGGEVDPILVFIPESWPRMLVI